MKVITNKKNQIIVLVVALMLVAACTERKSTQVEPEIRNPILPGFYPDPSICRVDSDYYLVNSSFSWYPGVPIFHSRDLRNWKQIGHVLNRPEQLNLDSLGVSRGIFAPAISHHNGIFFLVTTLVDKGGNFFVTAENPAGPWSNPKWLPEIDGIDPSFFFDDNDSCYIINNGPPPSNQPQYDGHRAIWIQRFDLEKQQLTGNRKIIVNGGSGTTKKPVWIEGPHIYKIDGWYYLMAAEGGTSENHSEVIFKSQSVWGPWEPWTNNPILSQRGLSADRENPITCTGHADLVETSSGEWWAVFLGCQPYDPTTENFYNTGRETFMAPVEWVDGWPVIGEKEATLKRSYPAPNLPEYAPDGYQPLNGSFSVRDEFDEETLPLYWNFLRTTRENWHSLANGKLVLQCRPEPLTGKGNPSLVARRQQHAFCTASAAISFQTNDANETAGLVVFQNEKHFYALLVSQKEGKPVLQLKKTDELLKEQQLDSGSIDIQIKIVAKGKNYDFEYKTGSENWKLLEAGVDGTFLSTRTAGGFVGCYFGLYSIGKPKNQATFDWFQYDGDE